MIASSMATAPHRPPFSSAPLCRVALVGFGTVGQSVARILTAHPPPGVRLTHIFNRRVARKKADWVPADVQWTEDIEDVFAAPVDIVIELVGGLDPAGTWARRTLTSGRSFVTANKQLIAHHGSELLALAARHGGELRFEGSVAGGIPILVALCATASSADRIWRVSGILNGTCNFILTSMEDHGASFADALAQAQALGYAEADPTDDVEGLRRARKARDSVRHGAARGCRAAAHRGAVGYASSRPWISCTPAGSDARSARSRRPSGTRRRMPCCMRPSGRRSWRRIRRSRASRAARTSCVLRGHYGGETIFSGSGAGGGPTSVAVVSDVAAIARQRAAAPVRGARVTGSTAAASRECGARAPIR